jgi:hypothetical protein
MLSALFRILFGGLFQIVLRVGALFYARKMPERYRRVAKTMDALTGVDPDADPNASDFRQHDIGAPCGVLVRTRGLAPISWRSIAAVIRQGRKFGIEFPATASPETRAEHLATLRTQLPYAEVRDEGEVSTPLRSKNGEATKQVWRIGIVLGEPGYGIANQDIDSRREEWIAAARDFRRCADDLLQTVMRIYDLDLDSLPHIGAMGSVPGGAEHGHSILGDELDAKWKIEFHNGALFLTQLETGQEVRVSMMHREIGGVLHGFGFSRWIKTTPQWQHLGALLGDDYFDARRVIVRLHEAGCLEVVPRNAKIRLLGTRALTVPV